MASPASSSFDSGGGSISDGGGISGGGDIRGSGGSGSTFLAT